MEVKMDVEIISESKCEICKRFLSEEEAIEASVKCNCIVAFY